MAQQKSLNSLKQEDKIRVCQDCGSKNIGYEKSEFYCKKCGLVQD